VFGDSDRGQRDCCTQCDNRHRKQRESPERDRYDDYCKQPESPERDRYDDYCKQPESPERDRYDDYRKQPESPRSLRSGVSLRSSSLVTLASAVLASSAFPERAAPFIPARVGWFDSLCGWD